VLRRAQSRQWQSYGRLDPYYGVLSADEYRSANLTPQALDEFYASGERHIDALFSQLATPPRTALDFGCGTGRVLVHLARRCERATGVDISPAMLEECRRACASRGLDNVTLCDRIPDGTFDLVHSVLVLQHLPVSEGYRAIERLLGALAPGGTIALHVTLPPPALSRLFYGAINLPLVGNAWNVLRGRPWSYPSMQMNGYRLDRVLALAARRGAMRSAIAYAPAAHVRDPDSVLIVATLPAAQPDRQPV
jgi:SAM-dependent methyltransferase